MIKNGRKIKCIVKEEIVNKIYLPKVELTSKRELRNMPPSQSFFNFTNSTIISTIISVRMRNGDTKVSSKITSTRNDTNLTQLPNLLYAAWRDTKMRSNHREIF